MKPRLEYNDKEEKIVVYDQYGELWISCSIYDTRKDKEKALRELKSLTESWETHKNLRS